MSSNIDKNSVRHLKAGHNTEQETSSTIAASVAQFGSSGKHDRVSQGNEAADSGASSRESYSAHTSKLPRVINRPLLDSSVAHYEELKANFLARHAVQPTRTILFSGTVKGDGATSTATNFAKTLALDPELKVLLIDANLRNPSLHNTFSINHTASLARLLEEDVPGGPGPPFRFEQGQVNVLPTGGIFSDPISIFASREFSEFLRAMQQTFDFIVLDGPPVFRSSDTRVLASKVDATILVIRSGKTRKQIVYRAIQELEAAGGKLLGTVLNRRKYYIPDWLYKRL